MSHIDLPGHRNAGLGGVTEGAEYSINGDRLVPLGVGVWLRK